MEKRAVILFDGVCNLCNRAVNFVIKRDRKSVFKFATLQSEIGRSLLSGNEINNEDLSSFILVLNEQLYSRSTAALKVCRCLSGLWPLMYGFIIVPKFIRDFVYDIIAKNRYKWFGKKESCMVPTPFLASKFLNDTL